MKSSILILLTACLAFTSYSQNKDLDKKQFGDKFSTIYDATSIVYYGLDFSNFELYNSKKVGTEKEVIKYIPAWIDFFDENTSFPNWKSKEVILNKNTIQKRYKTLGDDWISFEKHKINQEELVNIINSYELEEKSGIGLVIVVECLNKPKEKGYYKYVFFDIATKEILWGLNLKGSAQGSGMTKRWGYSLQSSLFQFNTLYKMKIKAEKKARK